MLRLLIIVNTILIATSQQQVLQPKILAFSTELSEEIPNNNNVITLSGRQVVNNIGKHLSLMHFQPIALLIQDSNQVLQDAEIYLQEIFKQSNLRSEFWLMKFNASGITSILAKTTNDIDYLRPFLRNNESTTEYLGVKQESAVIFFSILQSIRLLPFGSAILLFTDCKVDDEDLAQLAIKETIAKQIRIFIVWQGAYPTYKSEEKLLNEAADLTHGSFFIGNTERKLVNIDLETDNRKSIITHLVNIRGKRIVNVPIEQGVTRIHISLSTTVGEASFTSPNGHVINLLNETSVRYYAKESFIEIVGGLYEIELNTNAQNLETTGVWRLEANAFARDYNITISVENNLILNTKVIHANRNQGGQQILRLDLQGDFAAIENVSLVNEDGNTIQHLDTDFRAEDTELNIETINEKDVDIDLKTLPHKPVYIQVNGRDKRGNEFVRLSYFNRDLNYKIQSIVTEIGLGSDLLPSANQPVNIYFEVTNNKNQVIFVNFLCRDEKRLLRWMQPQWAWLNPRQTVVVTVNIFTRPQAGSNYEDLITFSAISGSEQFPKRVRMTVGNTKSHDVEIPHMWHKFTSNCLNVLLGRCEDATWTLEVTAQDRESGLLQVASNPPYLYFPHGYTSGSREEVTGIYSGSCCQSIIQLTAVDLVNNRHTYVVNAYRAPLGPGEITAIVLGLVLLIILIVALVCIFKCGKCKRKESDSCDLYTTSYRGPANSQSTRRY